MIRIYEILYDILSDVFDFFTIDFHLTFQSYKEHEWLQTWVVIEFLNTKIRNTFYTPSTLVFRHANKFPVFLVDSPVLRAYKLEIYSSVVKVGAAFVLYIDNSVHSRASKITNGALRIPFKFLKAICLSNFIYYPF